MRPAEVILAVLILGSVARPVKSVDNYFINCGSTTDVTFDSRIFLSDSSTLVTLTSPESISAKSSVISTQGIYQTVRILRKPSSYSFMMNTRGQHFIRLHFFASRYQIYDLTVSNFKVSTQNVVLLDNFTPANSSLPVFMEFTLNITDETLIITFEPLGSYVSFINAIEVISVPSMASDSIEYLDSFGLSEVPLQTIYRVDVGGPKVEADSDTLWRTWVSDETFLMNSNVTKEVTYTGHLNYKEGMATKYDAPDNVYNTARQLTGRNKMTWVFDVDGHSMYVIRLHFCDIVSKVINALFFNVYIDNNLIQKNADLSYISHGFLAVPYYSIYILRSSDQSGKINITIGPSEWKNVTSDGILNGIEIFKVGTGPVTVVEPLKNNHDKNKEKLWKKLAIILGSLLAVSFLLIVIAIGICFVLWIKKKPETTSTSSNLVSVRSDSEANPHHIPLHVLEEATNHFDEEMVIGTGGFGKVYKAVLWGDCKVAVKRRIGPSQGIKQFDAEIELLSRVRHLHVVSLIGYCNEKDEMILVYEYMEKGALVHHLHGDKNVIPFLSWKNRLEICIAAARGIHYLHTGLSKPIIHRDVKTENILLDENLMAKVGDFGISKTLPDRNHTHVSTDVRGTFGYYDPEYHRTEKLTRKSDVYSFGVVLLEVICARPALDPIFANEGKNLVYWATNAMKKGELANIVDERIAGTIRPESLRKYGEIVENCLAENGTERPTMENLLSDLESVLQLQEASTHISNISAEITCAE